MALARLRGVAVRWRVAAAAVASASCAATAWGALSLGTEPPAAPAAPLAPPATRVFAQRVDVDTFHKGNLHTHSAESDGDAPPAEVVRWYREHGYAFVAITDHNHRIDPRTYAHLERPGFVLLPGEELTMTAEDKPVHVNAICHDKKIGGGTFGSKSLALSFALEKIDQQGAIALVNHPNFAGALGPEELWSARGATLLEIYSGHPYVYSDGVDNRPSHEALWDQSLARGAAFFGAAVDDAHHFATQPEGKAARPGRAWIATYGAAPAPLTAKGVCEAIRAGRFYASSGAELERLVVGERAVTVWPKEPGARVELLGPGGVVLAAQDGAPDGATFELTSDVEWVRARVVDPSGARAWTQPLRTVRADP